MGAGGRENLCLPIRTGFAWHTEKRTGIWLNAKCTAAFAVYVDVISGKKKYVNNEW